MNIAYFSPLPPERSGIAAYSAMLLPALAKRADITLYTNNPQAVTSPLADQFSICPITEFNGPLSAQVDMCLYQMGNNTLYHRDIYRMLCRYPGVVTLHDVNLHTFYGDLYVTAGRMADYTREMAFSYGPDGVAYARDSIRGLHPYGVQQYALFGRVVKSSLGTIVHSSHAAQEIHQQYPQAPVSVIPLVQTMPVQSGSSSKAEAKQQLDFASETILLASFGYISANKRLDVTLRAFARLLPHYPQLRFALVGQVVDGYNLQPLLDELNLINDVVRLVGYADDDTFATYLAATDIGINLRYPSFGESSATLLRLLALGKPVLVSDVDSFAELPETAVIKITVDADEQSQIETQLSTLIHDESARLSIGSRAAQLVQEQHVPDVVAQRYVSFLQEVVGSG